MDSRVLTEIDGLRRASLAALRTRYRDIFGEEPTSRHREHLFRRIAWRLQALEEGDLSERTRRRAHEIALDADLRVIAPSDFFDLGGERIQIACGRDRRARDSRLPLPGTVLRRKWKGRMIAVELLADGFRFESRHYLSLSRIASEIAGTRWNGLAFFGLTQAGPKEQTQLRRSNSDDLTRPEIAAKRLRCAIYTRKSTEEGLDQEFNSLDAQREAAEAFIRSQRREGWIPVPGAYDDGGYTGANMDRPALARLLQAAEAREIDCVVVYKVDRLSRSLLDFTRILSLFEKHNVSFVAVTQQFNTSTSLGRLTLNILLSFAQFERELIGERTRDKMAAAKRKGKWTGGYLVLGYDVAPEGGRLAVNEPEAGCVRTIFGLFAQSGSLPATLAEIARSGWRLKSWTRKTGRFAAGGPFTVNSLRRLLTNPLYKGCVPYKGETYPGEHAAVITPALWDRVQTLIARRGASDARLPRNKHQALLGGLLYCEACAARMVYAWSAKNGVRYFYYVCLNAQRKGWHSCPAKSLPARLIEDSVLARAREECAAVFEPQSWVQMDRPGQVAAVRGAIERIGYSVPDRRISIRFRSTEEPAQ